MDRAAELCGYADVTLQVHGDAGGASEALRKQQQAEDAPLVLGAAQQRMADLYRDGAVAAGSGQAQCPALDVDAATPPVLQQTQPVEGERRRRGHDGSAGPIRCARCSTG